MSNKNTLIAGAVFVVLLLGLWLFSSPKQPGGGPRFQPTGTAAITFDHNQTLPAGYTVPRGTTALVKNGVTLTAQGDLAVAGTLTCEGGPLNLRVKGELSVTGQLLCNRGELAAGEVASGMAIVAKSFNIAKSAVVVSNGNVQLVTDAAKLATTPKAIEDLYQSVENVRTGKYRLGPLTPLEQIPAGTPGRPVSAAALPASVAVRGNLWDALVAPAYAQGPAVDANGNPVPNTTRIGGTWYVGNPGQNPPPNLHVPTPPKGVNHIILNFNFGNGGVKLQDFVLTGPDGRVGKDDVGKSCHARGGDGEDAMRFDVHAGNITIDNFDLHLGNGGAGGAAETTKDCDPGVATGGKGGSGGNFKMVADDKFDIEGQFNIYPGAGGTGGEATAHGKNGKDGCAGEKGGDATATGGKGGDNKKLLTVTGTVTGTDNITVHEMYGGKGGAANADGGKGGNGTGPGCAGGPGGKATATAGNGGDTSCNKFECTGGDGGDALAKPGNGGHGGQGTETLPGGNGGKGGDAKAAAGTGGTGKTKGDDGKVNGEKGGDGGNGGDGCGPGSGGAGGKGKPAGNPGADGKNLCVVKKTTGLTTPPPDTGTSTTPTPSTPPSTIPEPMYRASPLEFTFVHNIGSTQCPTPIGTFQVTGDNVPASATWQATIPPGQQWLGGNLQGQVNGQPGSFSFTCQLQQYTTQTVSTQPVITVKDSGGNTVKQFTASVYGQINAQH